jgi:hypothetical protein
MVGTGCLRRDYQAHVRSVTLQDLRAQPLLAGAIKGLDDQALLQVGKTGKHLLRLLDSERALPQKTRQAIAACCGLHRGRSAEELDRLIRDAAAQDGNPRSLGLASVHLSAVRKLLNIGRRGPFVFRVI